MSVHIMALLQYAHLKIIEKITVHVQYIICKRLITILKQRTALTYNAKQMSQMLFLKQNIFNLQKNKGDLNLVLFLKNRQTLQLFWTLGLLAHTILRKVNSFWLLTHCPIL